MRGRLSRVNHVDTDSTDGTSRRQFLRRAGITAALTAAVAGGADLAGMSAASAKVRTPGQKRSPGLFRTGKNRGPDTCCVVATYSPYKCNPYGHACESGECCFYLAYSGCSGETNHYACLGGEGCSSFSECA